MATLEFKAKINGKVWEISAENEVEALAKCKVLETLDKPADITDKVHFELEEKK